MTTTKNNDPEKRIENLEALNANLHGQYQLLEKCRASRRKAHKCLEEINATVALAYLNGNVTGHQAMLRLVDSLGAYFKSVDRD